MKKTCSKVADFRSMNNGPIVRWAFALLTAGAGLLPGFQQPQARAQARAPGLSREAHARAITELNRWGEHPRLLSNAQLLRDFSSEQLDQLMDQGNRILQAAAIYEMAHRREATSREKVQRIFDSGIPPQGALPLDSRAARSPDGLRFLAAVEFLAATERNKAIPKILRRPETWQMPREVAVGLRLAGQGWVDAALREAPDEKRLGAVGAMVAAGATIENAEEVAGILRTREGPPWYGAVVACERMDASVCWQALAASLESKSPGDQLRANMAAFRKGRTTQGRLLENASQVAALATSLPPGPELANSLMLLHEFETLAQLSRITVPEELSARMRQAHQGPTGPMPPDAGKE